MKRYALVAPVKIEEPKTTPIQKTPYDFPGVENESVTIIRAEFKYPATEPQIQQIAQLLGKNINIPTIINFDYKDFILEATNYVNKKFEQNYGEFEGFNYPINHEQAVKLLEDFIQNRLQNFGPYEDAIAKDESILFHSYLSSSINLGLLSPNFVVEKVLK